MTKRIFEFRNAQNTWCCRTDHPGHLCPTCLAKLAKQHRVMSTADDVTRAAVDSFVPPVSYPSLAKETR